MLIFVYLIPDTFPVILDLPRHQETVVSSIGAFQNGNSSGSTNVITIPMIICSGNPTLT